MPRRRSLTAVLAAPVVACALALLPALAPTMALADPQPVHGLSMHGDLKYGPDFSHFDYVNPDAPKGGTLRMSSIGTFDSLNPFIVRGAPAIGLGFLFDTLLTSSADEPFSEYGLVAETIEVPEDRSWVIFTLRPEARFHDGSPITAEDVAFSLDILREKGAPFYRFYYGSVSAVEVLGERRIRFTFGETNNHELPLIIGQLPILSKAYWAERDFEASTLEAPLGSGPYRVGSFEAGRHIAYQRDPNYWGADLAVNRGHYNFDTIRYDYYRDTTVALEAFRAGAYDLRVENIAREWATGYDFPARRDGRVVLKEFETHLPSGMQGFVMNQRRPQFADPRVRKALALAFDFEWANQNLFHGAYARTNSYFDNSELAARGLPSPEELELLEPWRDHLPEEVFTTEYNAPTTTGEGGIRANLRRALELLEEAGWTVQNGTLRHTASGEPMRFEILLDSPTFERVTNPYVQSLRRLGIDATVRTVDASQAQNRERDYDFDMVVNVWGQSLSPGNEQREFWGSEAARLPGSRNLAGVSNPAIDALIEQVIAAPDRDSLVIRTRALDRALQWQHLVVPHWHSRSIRIAHWDRFGLPETVPLRGPQLTAWWEERPR